MFRSDIYNIITKKEINKNNIVIINERSQASIDAEKAGLTSKGGKWYDSSGNYVAKTIDGKLTYITPAEKSAEKQQGKTDTGGEPKQGKIDTGGEPAGVQQTAADIEKQVMKNTEEEVSADNNSISQSLNVKLKDEGLELQVNPENPFLLQIDGQDVVEIDSGFVKFMKDVPPETEEKITKELIDYYRSTTEPPLRFMSAHNQESYDTELEYIRNSTRTEHNINGKNKRIDPAVNPSADPVFTTEDTGVLDTENGFSDWRQSRNLEIDKDKQIDVVKLFEELQIDSSRFPSKYIRVLDRMINTKNGSKLSVSDFIGGAGAGQLKSQAGEIFTMVLTTIDDDEKANELANVLKETLSKRSNSDNILEASWVDAALANRRAAYDHIRETYGPNAKIEMGCWDVREEVEGLGLGNYTEDKGYSTDAYFLVSSIPDIQDKILVEASLKKDGDTYFYNGGTGDIMRPRCVNLNPKEPKGCSELGWGLTEDDISPELNPNNFGSRQTKLYIDANDSLIESADGMFDRLDEELNDIEENYNNNEEEIENLKSKGKRNRTDNENQRLIDLEQEQIKIRARKKEIEEGMGEEGILRTLNDAAFKKILDEFVPPIEDVTKENMDEVVEKILRLHSDPEHFRQETGERLKKSPALAKINKVAKYVAELSPEGSDARKMWDKLKEEHLQYGKDLAQEILDNEKLSNGLSELLRDEFPIKSCIMGEEVMLIGDTRLNKKAAMEIFGTDDYEKIRENFEIQQDGENVSIVYKAKGTGEYISIAKLQIRQKGVGYKYPPSFNMGIHKEFNRYLSEYRDNTENK